MLTRIEFIQQFAEMVRDVADIDIDVSDLSMHSSQIKLYNIGIDSLTVISLLSEFEKRFNTVVSFDDIDEGTFDNAQNLIDFLFGRLSTPST